MIKINNQHEFNTIIKSLDTTLLKAYKYLEKSDEKIIEQVECLQNKNSNILIVQLQNSKCHTDSNKYVGILVSDLIQTILVHNPDLINNDENINQLRTYKSRISSLKIENYDILGYVTNQNKLQITIHQNSKLPDNICNTIILFPAYNSGMITEFIESFEKGDINENIKNQIEDNIIDPILKFNKSYYKLQDLSEIVSSNGIVYFDQPKSLIKILDYYHTGSKVRALLNKLTKPNEDPDVIFSDLNSFSGQRNLSIEQLPHLYLESWDINSDFATINNLINQAYFLRRKVNDSVKIKNIKNLVCNEFPKKEEKRVHKKAIYRV